MQHYYTIEKKRGPISVYYGRFEDKRAANLALHYYLFANNYEVTGGSISVVDYWGCCGPGDGISELSKLIKN